METLLPTGCRSLGVDAAGTEAGGTCADSAPPLDNRDSSTCAVETGRGAVSERGGPRSCNSVALVTAVARMTAQNQARARHPGTPEPLPRYPLRDAPRG